MKRPTLATLTEERDMYKRAYLAAVAEASRAQESVAFVTALYRPAFATAMILGHGAKPCPHTLQPVVSDRPTARCLDLAGHEGECDWVNLRH